MKKLYALLGVVGLILALCLILWQVSKARTFQSMGKLVHRIETSRKIVALPFDGGPSVSVDFTQY